MSNRRAMPLLRRGPPIAGVTITLAAAMAATMPAAAQAPTAGGSKVGIANPAAVACIEAAGRLEIRSGADGQSGWCHLPDGRICEEWALFRDRRCVAPPDAAIPAPPPKP
ncbi:MAG: DUF333 domain-containing protein [Siculibacillus sp.]|nr:DUF333 domain-containing protein [Siculibacillus sp.]